MCVVLCVMSTWFDSLDPAYTKAYYRRGSANYALGKYKLALKDFKHVVRTHPKDREAIQKMKVGWSKFVILKDSAATMANASLFSYWIMYSCRHAKLRHLLVQECEKAVRVQAFAEAIETEHTKPLSETLEVDSIGETSAPVAHRASGIPSCSIFVAIVLACISGGH